MSKVRPITWIGFGLSILAIVALFVSPALALGLGFGGVAISIYALATAND